MKTKLLLRIASGLMIFHILGHTFGHSGWRHSEDPVQQEVIRQMTEHSFPFMGAVHSIGDYYEGYGWCCSIALLFFALSQWFISSHAEEHAVLSRKLLGSLSVCLVAWSILEFIFFFAFAGTITLVSAVLTIISFIRLKGSKT